MGDNMGVIGWNRVRGERNSPVFVQK